MAGLDGVNPALAAAFQAMQAASPYPLGISSGYRSYQEQAALYQAYLNGTGNLAAPPGHSNHESGNAIDIDYYDNDAAIQWVQQHAPEYGLHFPVRGENWHAELFGEGGGRPGAGLDQDALRFNLAYGTEAQNPEDVLTARLDTVMAMLGGADPDAETPEAMISPQIRTDTQTLAPEGVQAPDMQDIAYGGPGAEGDRLSNARIIAQVGQQMGLPSGAIQIALAAALVESNLVNVHYGDRDSLGLFQQRPSQGWGTPDQVLNPQYAARKFFEGLMGIDWQNMTPGQAAQAVQRSAFPSRYGERFGEAVSIYNQISGGFG